MKLYSNFIGIDIGKLSFVVAVHGKNKTKEYDNDASGIQLFMKEHKTILSNSLCVLETTGGYELRLVFTLCEQGYKVHRANACKVKYFIRSFGNKAKTDSLDAKALALYGYERADRLDCFTPLSKQSLALYELVQRRRDLTKLRVAEKNRLKAPRANIIQESCRIMIEMLTTQIQSITQQICALIEADPILQAKQAVLQTIPGVGPVISFELLVLLPELGTLSRREIASLAGVAPKANDSGQFNGYRVVGHGRDNIKPILFLAAMAARCSNSSLKAFYNNLIAAGKIKMVALTALMRKIIVIANARLRDYLLSENVASTFSAQA